MANDKALVKRTPAEVGGFVGAPSNELMKKYPALAIAWEKIELVQTMLKDRVLKEGVDYGQIEGTNNKMIFKSGCEMLCIVFALEPEFELDESKSNFEDKLIRVRSTCRLFKTDMETGFRRQVAMAMGTCSSLEIKYRYRWLYQRPTEIPASVDKMDTVAWWKEKYGDKAVRIFKGSPPQYRIENPDIYDIENTIVKMANQRSLRSAVLLATGADRIFISDKDIEKLGLDRVPDDDDAVTVDEDGVVIIPATDSPQKDTKATTAAQEPAKSTAEKNGKEELDWKTFYDMVLESCKKLGWTQVIEGKTAFKKEFADFIGDRYYNVHGLKDLSQPQRKDLVNQLLDLVAAKSS